VSRRGADRARIGGVRWRALASAVLAAGLLPWRVATQPAGDWKPVSFAILEDYDAGDDLDDVRADFALFDQLEIRTWRGSFGWDDYERERGRYDFTWLDRFVTLAARHHIQLRPYLGYTPEWAASKAGSDGDVWNNPPARLADWERFASAIGRALARHANVLSYEIYNEENVKQWWDGTAEQYASVMVSGSRALRRRDRDASVIFGGLVFPDVDWIETVCGVRGARQAFSVLPIHAYPETWTPADVTVENYFGGLQRFVSAADRACGPKAIWVNETGFATVPGRSERDQAAWWVRAVATFLAIPRIEHIGVYEIKDLPADRPAIGDAPNYHLGLTRSDRTPKLAFYTMDLLTDLLDVGKLAVEDDRVRVTVEAGPAGELHSHLFRRPDGDRVLFVWDRLASPAVRVDVPASGGVIEYDFQGRPFSDPNGAVLQRLQLSAGVPRMFRLTR
jgi:polysaccharide biosynthesis protein PslG